MADQFAPIDKPYLSQWRDRLSDPKPAKVKPKPRKKVKASMMKRKGKQHKGGKP